MAINGPEFSKEKDGSAGLWSGKVAYKASNGLSFPNIGDQRPHHSVAKQSHIAGQMSRDAPALVVIMSTRSDKIWAAIRGKDHACSTTHSTGGAYKASRTLPDNSQTVAAIPSEESLQLRVNKSQPPRREANPAPFGTHRCH